MGKKDSTLREGFSLLLYKRVECIIKMFSNMRLKLNSRCDQLLAKLEPNIYQALQPVRNMTDLYPRLKSHIHPNQDYLNSKSQTNFSRGIEVTFYQALKMGPVFIFVKG